MLILKRCTFLSVQGQSKKALICHHSLYNEEVLVQLFARFWNVMESSHVLGSLQRNMKKTPDSIFLTMEGFLRQMSLD